jgi:hypothetical protein|tara:strand:- start:480 stop:806 length:327 start_codon:yes stop_codon:yes gene_type:complete
VANKKVTSKKIISLPIPLDLWFKDAQKVDELRKVLESEALQTAIAVLKEIAGPSNGGIGDDAVSTSQRYAWYAGYRDAFNDLHKLTRYRTETKIEAHEEWKHIQTPPL